MQDSNLVSKSQGSPLTASCDPEVMCSAFCEECTDEFSQQCGVHLEECCMLDVYLRAIALKLNKLSLSNLTS